jgi:hypothetical protein
MLILLEFDFFPQRVHPQECNHATNWPSSRSHRILRSPRQIDREANVPSSPLAGFFFAKPSFPADDPVVHRQTQSLRLRCGEHSPDAA